MVGYGDDSEQYHTHNGVMVGPTADPEQPVPDALRMRVNNPGLNLVLDTVEDQITGEKLEPMLLASNPVYDKTEDDLSIKADVTKFGLSQTELDLKPGEGFADLHVRLWDLEIGVDIDAKKGGFYATPSQTITAERVDLVAKLKIAVVDGKLDVVMSDSDVTITNFGFDDSKWPSWLSGAFTDMVFRELIEGALRTLLNDMLPGMIQEKLAELELSFDTQIMERDIGIQAVPSTAEFDPNGLLLGTHMDVTVSGIKPVSAPGYLSSAPAVPVVDEWQDMSLALSDDLLNRVMFEAWRAELLTYELKTEDESLPPYVLDLIGGEREGRIVVKAGLPPAIVQVEDHLQAQIGEIHVRVETPNGEYGNYVDLAVGGTIDLDVNVVDGKVQLTFGDKVVEMVVRDSDWGSDIPRVTDQVAGILPLEAALNVLEDMEIPLPTVAGIGVKTALVERDKSTTHTGITVDLVEVEQ